MAAIETRAGTRDAALASVAGLIGDPSRATILSALLDGRAQTAGELARAASVAPQTASGHLAQLVAGGLLAVDAQGRHRYYRIASADVAHAIEALLAITPPLPDRAPDPRVAATACARMCYDHLAGQLGVGLADALVAREVLARSDREFLVTAAGAAWFADFGVDLEHLRQTRRKFATACLDRTERRHHLGGALGAALAARLFELGWVARTDQRRALRITVAGRAALDRTLRLSFGGPVWRVGRAAGLAAARRPR